MKLNRDKVPFLLPLAALAFVALLQLSQGAGEAYVTIARWAGNSTEYVTASSLGAAPFPSGTTGLVNNAAAAWSKPATGKEFTIVNFNGQIGPTRARYTSGNFGSLGFPDDPGINAVGISGGRVVSSVLYLNSTWTWNKTCTLNQAQKKADVYTILLHETGHTVSLNHDSSQTAAVMWPNFVCKQSLTADDKAGIDALY